MRGQAVTKKDRGGRVIFTFVSFVGRFQERKERRQGDRKEERGGGGRAALSLAATCFS